MNYKGYKGQVVDDDAAEIFHGDVIGLRDVITFQGKSVKELKQAFKDSIESYLELCRKIGTKPDKTFSGKLTISIDVQSYHHISIEAALKRISINELLNRKINS